MSKPLSTAFLAFVLTAAASFATETSATQEDMPDPGTTYLDGTTVSIEMDLGTGRPMVELMIDGKGPFKFVVDTGAGLSVIDQGIAEELGLEVVGTQTLHSPGASEDIVGDRVQAGLLEVGGLRVEKPVLATMDLRRFSMGTIEGVLGRPHFREYLLTFDYPESKIVVTRGTLDRSDPAVVGYEDGGSIRFPVDVAGISVPMVLDTGSQGGFSLPKAMESRFRFGSEMKEGPKIRLVGGAHQTWMSTLDGTVRLGDIRYQNPDIVLATYSEEFGNIGARILRELKVTLDQENKLVRFEQGVTAGAGAVRGDGQRVRIGGPVRMGGPDGRPQLGVRFEMTPAGFVKRAGGLVVEYVVEGGSAESAGLTAGDIVLTLGGTSVAEIEDMMAIVKLVQGPRPIEMGLLRGDERLTVSID